MKKLTETVKYRSTGLVFGNFWGGGRGTYPAVKLSADTKEELIKKATEGLDGSLDSGMGYESLIGAILDITKITSITYGGKTFTNEEVEVEFIGELTEKDQDFLLVCDM
jgi:hypothetical protein